MNDFQKYVSQNKDRAKEVGPGVYKIPLIQEELTPSFKLNSPYMQGAENGGLYAFVDSTGNIIPNQDRMVKTYTLRQIQENLQYAASKGQTKMRYPTPETAAKIEGYPSITNSEGEISYAPPNI